jgi:diketogulonate reductase-like aldo/keto reductase
MKKLGVDYLDAVLINNPVPWGEEGKDYTQENIDVYNALETLYKEEKVGAIGVSNFDIDDLEALLPHVTVKPHLNQIAIFIGHTLDRLRQYCKAHNIIIQGHSPLARGRLLKQPYVKEHAKKLRVTESQLALKYVLAKGVYPVVKASKTTHLINNLKLDFSLPQSILETLDAIHQDVRDYKPPKAKRIL